MTAFLRPKKPPFIRGEPGQHGDQWLMSEADLEEYARADRAQQLDLPPDLSVEQIAAWLHLNLYGYVDAKAVRSDAQRVPLTEDQVFASQDLMHLNGSLLYLAMPQLIEVIRVVERAHGIEEGKR